MNTKFKAFVVREAESGVFKSAVEERKVDDLPVGDLLIKVSFSSINYKDALSASGNKGVSKNYPHTPGIDAAGIIADSSSTKFKIDDKVVVTGYDLGMNTSGGFAEYIRVPEEWVLKLPSNISLEQSMGIGTAGLTAGMCIKLLEQKNSIIEKEAIVTGASGGVGCLSVYLLSKLGARVTAVTSKMMRMIFYPQLVQKPLSIASKCLTNFATLYQGQGTTLVLMWLVATFFLAF